MFKRIYRGSGITRIGFAYFSAVIFVGCWLILRRISVLETTSFYLASVRLPDFDTLDGKETNFHDKSREAAYRQKKVILLWYSPFGRHPTRTVPAQQCGNCEITYDRNKIESSDTGAVVFHFNELKASSLPLIRNSQHFYVWWTHENPRTVMKRRKNLKKYDNFFNLTMTYRRDSDIYSPYGTKEEIVEEIWANKTATEVVLMENERFEMKKKLAVVFISNCDNTPHAILRFKLVERLHRLGLEIDRFGDCFSGPKIPRRLMPNTIQQYKFYFAFENSLYCRDYITEKFFKNALGYGALPVVFGALKEDYDAVAPPHSYIYADDFETSQELADYINYLDHNNTAYREYFQWRLQRPELNKRETKFCQLCRFLHGLHTDKHESYQTQNKTRQSHVVKSLSSWFYGTENKKCFDLL